MRRKPLGYSDAVTLLGGKSKVVTGLSRVAGAGLAIASAGTSAALSLFDLKGEVEHLGQDAVVTLRNRVMGLNRFARSELIEAAHALLVVSSFFMALDDLSEDLRTALNSASLELTRAEQAVLATGSGQAPGSAGLADLARELIAPGAIPGMDAGWSPGGSDLEAYYAGLARRIRGFATGTAVWDQRDETTRSRWSAAICDELPTRALARYEGQLGQLAGEFPEFAFWAHRVGVQTVLDELRAARKDDAEAGQMLQTIVALMQSVTRGSEASKVRSDLVTRYRKQLDTPIAGAVASAIPDEVTLPHLREIYVNPSYRMLPRVRALPGEEWVSEPSWQRVPRGGDLSTMVLTHLYSTDAARVPLMLLGQPGAGKSVFTQMLAASLDPRAYLVVRVELRAVPSDAKIQRQIECALGDLTGGRQLTWPELAEDAGDAQALIILDGFDELLQASGEPHFDFLELVQDFQGEQAGLGRPVAVLVTSRTAVANQVRYPDGTVVARLEEFDDTQVSLWLDAWNRANPARPLSVEAALAQGELARQPLLLFLLALFNSGGGALAPGIGQAQLYGKLFTDFLDRDVTKTQAGSRLSDQQRHREVRRELDLLSMVAFAMFNRGRQTVTETDLIADLTALKLGKQPEDEEGSAALTIAERMAGRFFFRLFMQRDQAIRGQQTKLSTYEYLHASFGEFLVARWVVDEASRLAELDRRGADDIYRQPIDDKLFRALLSVAVLSSREQRVLDFIAELLAGLPPGALADMRRLVGTLFLGCLKSGRQHPYPQYRPVVQAAPAMYAVYSANLLLLLLLVIEAGPSGQDSRHGGLTIAQLYEDVQAPAGQEELLARFHGVTRLWHAQLTASEWDGLLDVIRLDRIAPADGAASGADPEYRIVRWRHSDRSQPMSGRSMLPGPTASPLPASDGLIWFADPAGRALREAALLGSAGYQGACAALLPYLGLLGTGDAVQPLQLGGRAADMLALLLASSWDMPFEQRVMLYTRFADFPLGLRQARMLLSQLRDERELLPLPELARITAAIDKNQWAWTNITAYLDILACLNDSMTAGRSGRRDSLVSRPRAREIDPRSLMLRSGLAAFRPQNRNMELFSPRGLRDLKDIFTLRQGDMQTLQKLRSASSLRSLLVSARPDQHDLLILRDVLDLKDLSDLLKLTRRSALAVLRGSPVTEVVLWTAMAQRGLPVSAPRRLVLSDPVKHLRAIAPGFVAQTRRLAADRGYPDPFPDEAQFDEPPSSPSQ